MKVAIVHDWLISGGAERVVDQLHKMFPEAPIYTSYATQQWRKRLDNRVITGYLQHWPFSKLRKFVPFLRGLWFSRLDLEKYDLVISSSGAEAKFVKVKPSAKHVAYIHAPTHYYWDRYNEYLKSPGLGFFDPLARIGLKILVGPMRAWDYKAAQRPEFLIANSSHTQNMIKKYYNRVSVVIHPPVDIERFKPSGSLKRHGFVIAGRQAPYKRFDLAVKACTKLNLPLTVIGSGPEHKKLVAMAGPSIKFLGSPPDFEVALTFEAAEAFIFPGLDDFGIVAVEAMAAGTPVIAYKAGGALDYIIDGVTGLFFEEQSVGSLVSCLRKFNPKKFEDKVIRAKAEDFSPDKFKSKIKKFLEVKL